MLPEMQARLQNVRSQYTLSPWIRPHEDEQPLLRSWQRCEDAGMLPHERVSFELVSKAWLAELDDVHGEFVRRSRPETERLAQSLRGTGCVVLLFNTRGVVVDRLGDDASTPLPLLVGSRKGVNVAERCVGTTAPAIALREGLPYLVGRDAHFFSNMRPFFCVAAPVDDPRGNRLAALDITSYDRVPAFDVLSLVTDAAAAIENSLFVPGPDRLVVRFHPRADLVGTAMEALLLLDGDGLLCGVNRMAARLLGRSRQALLGCRFSELFDRRVQHLFGRGVGRADRGLVELVTPQGLQVQARFESEGLREAASTNACEPTPMQPVSVVEPAGSLRDVEIRTIERTLATLDGNVAATARQLGISRNTIYRRLQERREMDEAGEAGSGAGEAGAGALGARHPGSIPASDDPAAH